MENIKGLFALAIFGGYIIGIISLIKPISSLKIHSRKAAGLVLFGSFASTVIFGAIFSPPQSARTVAAPRESVDVKQSSPLSTDRMKATTQAIDTRVVALNICVGPTLGLIEDLSKGKASDVVQVYRQSQGNQDRCSNAKIEDIETLLSEDAADAYEDEFGSSEKSPAREMVERCNRGSLFAWGVNNAIEKMADGDASVSIQSSLRASSESLIPSIKACAAARERLLQQLKLNSDAMTPVIVSLHD